MACTGFRRLLGVFNLSLGLLGVAALVIGVFLMQDALDPTNLPGHEARKCTLTKAQILPLPANGPGGTKCGYTVVWRDASGASAIDDPFAVTDSKIVAASRMIDYPLHVEIGKLAFFHVLSVSHAARAQTATALSTRRFTPVSPVWMAVTYGVHAFWKLTWRST